MTDDNLDRFSEMHIDKTSPLPYHYQLRELIRVEITSNRWQVGDQLPSENRFCDYFQVSRTTVREALDALVSEGLLIREKGVGTFVAAPKYREQWSGSSVGFSDSLTEQGYLIDTRVLDLHPVQAPHDIRQELYLQSDDNVILLKRLRFIMQQPILFVKSYLPEKLFPGLTEIDFSNRSLYQTLRENYQVRITRIRRRMESIAADESVAALLEVKPGFPIMYIENTAFDDNGVPIEYYIAWRRGDKARFEFEYTVAPEE